jgi:hypothetical protein
VRRSLLLLALVLAAVAPASAGAPRRVGLVVWPARSTLAAGTATSLHVANHTRHSMSLTVRAVGLALDLRGAPRVIRSSAGTSLVSIGRHQVAVAAGRVEVVRVRARAAHGSAAGDRPALVLVTARSAGGAGIGVQVRIGVPVEVRVPGAVHRQLQIGPMHVRRRRLDLLVRNRGNVEERLDRGTALVEVWRASRRLATLHPRPRDLLPHTRGLLEFRVPKRFRGQVRLVVRIRRPTNTRRAFLVAF